ncbi:PAS domain-containing protein [Rhizobium oryzicola]|uniref:PAS domain-containing protein n=1 Tax=Rhizobium oryzicola TaxID=1232668 RepID=A0ABT8T0N8_9HYPH|nr:PAS domain-containing protein [Rhizobium oryzicola]MDO1584191.1 PAS domain-containing protein [Rhizobium oryzicola]
MASFDPPSVRSLSFTPEQVGVFCWDLRKDLVQADAPIAELFGVEPEELSRGLPIAAMLLRIHEEDRPDVARSMHETITSGQQYCTEHRVIRPDGSVRHILSIGHCFRDENDLPSVLTGVIFADLGEMNEGREEIESTWRIASYRTAHALARNANHARVEMALEEALLEMGEEVATSSQARVLC